MRLFKKIIPVLLITAVTIGISLGLYRDITKREEERCWQILQETAQSVSQTIANKFKDETVKLHLVAELMLLEDNLTVDDAEHLHLDKLQDSSIFSRIDILYPNNVIVSSNGTQRLLPDALTIDEVVTYGEYLSGRNTDLETGEECVYYSLPIIRDAETLAVLIGVISAESLLEVFQMTIYEGQANICIIDSGDGDFLMDSWHDTLGNIYEMKDRERLKEYEDVDLKNEIRKNEAGVIAFVSNTTGQPLYMYFAPIGVFDWQLEIFVQEDVLFENLFYVKGKLLYVEIVEIFLLTLYFFWNFRTVRQLERSNAEIALQRERLRQISYRDLLTNMYNRNRYEEVLDSIGTHPVEKIGVAYLDLNSLKRINDTQSHAAGDRHICTVANGIMEVFGESGYRIGGDEFVILVQEIEHDVFTEQVEALRATMAAKEADVSVGSAWWECCKDIRALIKTAETQMYAEKERYYAKNGRR